MYLRQHRGCTDRLSGSRRETSGAERWIWYPGERASPAVQTVGASAEILDVLEEGEE